MPTYVRDSSLDDDNLEFCIYGGVWVGLDSFDDGTVIVQYIEGLPEGDDDGHFEELLGEAGGLFGISLDEVVDDTRTRDLPKTNPQGGQRHLFTDLP